MIVEECHKGELDENFVFGEGAPQMTVMDESGHV